MKLSKIDPFSISYHDRFDYPLTLEDLEKWRSGKLTNSKNLDIFLDNTSVNKISSKGAFYFLKGRDEIIKTRLKREKWSENKMERAKTAANLLSIIPSVKMVGVTGSLAMKNADPKSDIDFLIITTKGMLWLTRFMVYLLLMIFGYKVRKPKDSNERDKLCLNMWFDESDLIWPEKKRSYYTAHEIAQVIPLLSRDGVHERFLWKNRWILDYWPNSVKIKKGSESNLDYNLGYLLFFEKVAFAFQRFYMRRKITNEVISKTRAIFHPKIYS